MRARGSGQATSGIDWIGPGTSLVVPLQAEAMSCSRSSWCELNRFCSNFLANGSASPKASVSGEPNACVRLYPGS